jgi:hypothetical protein
LAVWRGSGSVVFIKDSKKFQRKLYYFIIFRIYYLFDDIFFSKAAKVFVCGGSGSGLASQTAIQDYDAAVRIRYKY